MNDISTSDAPITRDAPKRNLDKFNKARQRKVRLSELDEFRVWLANLGFQAEPKVHVNGSSHSTAVVVVDFGTPLIEPAKLTPEQTAELIGHVRTTTRSLYHRDREINVRVQNDSANGIWWANVT